MTAETTCRWYVTEDNNAENEWDYVHCTDESGFCLLKDLFTKCYGKCKEYIEEKGE